MTILASKPLQHLLVFGGLLVPGLAVVFVISAGSNLASARSQCFPFLGATTIPGELTIASGNGEVTSSSHPKILKPGFGKTWKLSSGGYNPKKKQLMLVLKDRYFGLFLEKPLRDGQAIKFKAEPCGEVNQFGILLGDMIRPGLFFDFGQRRFDGTLTKTGDRLQGTFMATSGFYLSDQPGKEGLGKATGRFAFQLKPGKDRRFPEPSPDAIRGLW
ncbi:MAG: hypothetical protein ACK41W_09665 [Cyanobacteriota bacterium]|jgi:hypothetical protein